ncbi:MAG TPA: acyl-ACP thioesterase domain-containing protein [Ktedonobacterales bacterium]|nr:acyl-ACP thioesterase domain-containing protein [Ktedonobacterales bacterium]
MVGSSTLAEQVGDAPAGAYTLALQVRSYEVLRSGKIAPATLLRYLEYVATEASAHLGFDHTWYEMHGSAWVVREMSFSLAQLPGIDDELMLATWLSDYKRVQAVREYAVWNRRTGKHVARARARWAYIDRYRATPMRIHDELLARFPLLGHAMRNFTTRPGSRLKQDEPGRQTELVAREYEADTQQHVNNCTYVDWLYEELHAALATASELAAGRVALPRRYTIEYARPTLPGDGVRIETSIATLGSRMLAASQEIVNLATGATTVRAFSEHLLVPHGAG